ncbi:MAG: glutaminase A [Xanthomonadales bacterium]|nr:glutaminase A [Xanthomonadales bacterium]
MNKAAADSIAIPSPARDESLHSDSVADMYRALLDELGRPPTGAELSSRLRQAGIDGNDRRISKTLGNLERFGARECIDAEHFERALAPDEATLVQRALSGDLVIPDFAGFTETCTSLFEECRSERGGHVATYIPQLARVDPELYALGICTIDGQRFSVGDAGENFCVQSTCKPVTYATALEMHGRDVVHRHVGREPSGRSFNELTLNAQGLPHNPMINAGAIMCSSLIDAKAPLADRFDRIMSVWREMAGGAPLSFDNATYLSEKESADRNFALAYFMREKQAFPPQTDVVNTLDFYFQCCSISLNVREMSVIAATLANGGVCPTTNRRVLKPDTVKDCLSLMYSCGMYDFSGEYAFTVGIPAKSGVSGAMMLVVPGVCGIAVWSPRLDELGNSVRGVAFSKRLVETFPFHTYANMLGDIRLQDPTTSHIESEAVVTSSLCAAAARGDLSELRRLVARGADVSRGDYDGRTPLHLAASEGQVSMVRLLLALGGDKNAIDRWGNTPRDDALREGFADIINLLPTP